MSRVANPSSPARNTAFVLAALLLALGSTGTAAAESRLLESGAFELALEVTVPETPEEAFEAFTAETLQWWDHHFSEQPRELRFEPWPGGRFVEIFDNQGNGALHATVILADRGKLLRFAGPLGFSGQALEMVHSLSFEPVETGGTRVKLDLRGAGQLQQGWPEAVEAVWRHFLEERFLPYMQQRGGS